MNIAEVLINKIDIVDFIGQYTELRRESSGYKGKCPLHDGESDSALWVTPDTNSYYCFSCCSGGNVINFYAELEGLGYFQALEILAEKYNINLDNDKQYKSNKDVIRTHVLKQQQLVKHLPTVIEYLKQERKFTEEIINEFGIGYDNIGNFPIEDKNGKKVFKGITIPIYDLSNRLIAFGKRRLPGDEQKGKYINTFDWELYHKGKTLFNLNKVHKMAKKQKLIYLAEGFFDVMSFWQQELPAVGYCCASLSKDHVKLLKETFKHIDGLTVVLAADNDAAGIGKVARMRELFQKEAPKLNVRVLLYSNDCKDANDLLIKGIDIKTLQTEHIDLFCVNQLLLKYTTKEQQYTEIEKFMLTVKNELIKADICAVLAKKWGQELENIKKQFSVRTADINEKLSDFSSVLDCLNTLDKVLNEEEIGVGYPSIDANVTFHKKWVVILGAYSFTGKCVDENSLVKTSIGYRKIKDLTVGEKVVTFSEVSNQLEFGEVKQVIDTGMKDGYMVTTRRGKSIIVSEDHPFLTPNGWVKINQGLSIKDQIAIPAYLPNEGNLEAPIEEIEFLALMIADGSCGSTSLKYSKNDPYMIDVMKNVCKHYGTELYNRKGCNWEIKKAGAAGMNNILRRYGLLYKHSWEKFIPEQIFTYNKRLQKRFIELLFNGDGWVLNDEVGYSSASETLIQQLSNLLMIFGIRNTIYSKNTNYTYKGERKKGRKAHYLLISREYAKTFIELFNLSLEKNDNKFTWNKTGRTYYDNVRISQETTDKIMDYFKGKHKEINTIVGKPIYSHRRGYVIPKNFTQKGFTQEQYKKINEVVKFEELKHITSTDIYFEEIVSIEEVGKVHMYDIEVLNGHNFVANNILVHNTNNLVEWILHWVVRQKKRVLFFSLEMPREDVIEIIIGKILGIPPYKVKEVIKTEEGSKIYQQVVEKIQKYLYIIDKNSLSIDDIEEYVKIANTRVFDEPVDIVCVDYYQYLSGTIGYENDSQTARKMKEIAKNNNIVLVMLSQFNKQSQYKDKSGKVLEPNQNDLKGAGDIGASADVIYLIWRPYLTSGESIDAEDEKYITCLKVAKARKGLKKGQSHFRLVYNPDTGRLSEKL